MDHGDDGNDSGQDDSINDNSYDESAEFQFLDDTGAAIMVMYEDDLEYLENKASQVAKIVGAARLNAAFGHSVVITYRIEVNLQNSIYARSTRGIVPSRIYSEPLGLYTT